MDGYECVADICILQKFRLGVTRAAARRNRRVGRQTTQNACPHSTSMSECPSGTCHIEWLVEKHVSGKPQRLFTETHGISWTMRSTWRTFRMGGRRPMKPVTCNCPKIVKLLAIRDSHCPKLCPVPPRTLKRLLYNTGIKACANAGDLEKARCRSGRCVLRKLDSLGPWYPLGEASRMVYWYRNV